MGPEQEKLMSRLFDDPNRKLVNFNIFRGDKPASAEQLCAEVNKAMDEVARIEALPIEEQMRIDIRYAYEAMSKVIPLCQFDVRDWDKPVEDARKRLGDIFCALDMALVQLGNWLPHEDRLAIRKTRAADSDQQKSQEPQG